MQEYKKSKHHILMDAVYQSNPVHGGSLEQEQY
jgi:hypothetical protein